MVSLSVYCIRADDHSEFKEANAHQIEEIWASLAEIIQCDIS